MSDYPEQPIVPQPERYSTGATPQYPPAYGPPAQGPPAYGPPAQGPPAYGGPPSQPQPVYGGPPAQYPPAYGPPVQPIFIHQAPAPSVVMINQQSGPGCLVRSIWFVCFGWWLGMLITGLGWMLCASILGLPVGLALFNRLPQAMTLKPSALHTHVHYGPNGQMIVQSGRAPQHPFWLRAAYFVGIGWWLSAIWLLLAWSIGSFSLGMLLPISFVMFDQVPAIITLQRG